MEMEMEIFKAGDSNQKQSVEKSVEQEGRVNLGPKCFASSLDMFRYFYKFIHYWPPHLHVNKYEHLILLELLKKGHAEPDNKMGGGIRAFQVGNHPSWRSRCFFLVREDGSVDDFSFRKCVDHILPLPKDMKPKSDVNKEFGGRGGRGRRRGRGSGGRHRR